MPLHEDPCKNYLDRRLAASTNRTLWHRFRQDNVTATDIALLAGEKSIPSIIQKKATSTFSGNQFTEHGNKREPEIAAWVKKNHKVAANNFLYHAQETRRHLATPDGLSVVKGELVLAEIKTTNKPFSKIPAKYLRQVYWQQYVLGASKTIFVWEEHKNFIPVSSEPEFIWIERDEDQIRELVRLANMLVEQLDATDRNTLKTLKPAVTRPAFEPDISRGSNNPFDFDYSGVDDISW
jgi:hypothetical protein